MKTWRLTSGILCCVFAPYIIYQVNLLSKYLAITGVSDSGVLGGLVVAALFVGAGVVSIANRAGGKGSNIALLSLFTIAALFSFLTSKIYQDLKLFGIWSIACGIIAMINFIFGYGEPE